MALIGIDPAGHGTHSQRHTKVALIYRRTCNLRACQLLLGHTKLESTVWPASLLAQLPSDRTGLFANLKTSLRAQTARTVADLGETIKQAFGRFTPVECRNYVVAAGYDAFDPT